MAAGFNEKAVRDQARAECQERRARVLKHPDLAKRLTEAPLKYGRPEAWNGYVPPAEGPWGGQSPRSSPPCNCSQRWHGHDVLVVRNDSPQRAALVEICAEALARETAETKP
jgi:hypothetical protein